MKHVLYFFSALLIFAAPTQASENCFIAQEQKGQTLICEGDKDKRYAPCSTFKIVLALMGYDHGLLKDETHPEWPFKAEYEAFLESWTQPQTPTTWMKNSCVWYSQVLTPQLGQDVFQRYIHAFQYGNQDISGDVGQNNGLTHCWLSSSLEISPQEQLRFLEALLAETLPVSVHAHRMTKKIMYVEDLPQGWKLYGKTGSGYLLTEDRKKQEIKHGWFIGWIEKGPRKILFVHHIVDNKKEEKHSGPRAKKQAKEKLLHIIHEK